MLRNRYVIAALAALLVAVVWHNISFFAGRSEARKAAAPVRNNGSGQTAAALPPREPVAGRSMRRDPFWYDEAGKRSGRTPLAQSTRSSGIRFEGTMTKDGKGYALVNGEIVGIGDTVGAATIEAIGDRSITIRTGGGTRTIRLLGDLPEKE